MISITARCSLVSCLSSGNEPELLFHSHFEVLHFMFNCSDDIHELCTLRHFTQSVTVPPMRPIIHVGSFMTSTESNITSQNDLYCVKWEDKPYSTPQLNTELVHYVVW